MSTQLSPATTLWYLVQLGSVFGSRVLEAVVAVAVDVADDAEVLLAVPIQTASPVSLGELPWGRGSGGRKGAPTNIEV